MANVPSVGELGAGVTTVPGLLEVVARHGEATAVVLGEQRLSYRELEETSGELAAALLGRGIGKGTRIGLLLSNGPAWVTWWAALSRVGAIVVPLSTMAKGPELARVIEHADLHAIVMARSFRARDLTQELEGAVEGLADQDPDLALPSLPYLRFVVVIDGAPPAWARGMDWVTSRPLADEVRRSAGSNVHGSDIAIIIYTSGQSDEPKGVAHTHRSVVEKTYYLRESFGFQAGFEVPSTMPFFWVGGLVMALLPGLLAGATVVCQETSSWGPPQVIGAGKTVANPFPEGQPVPSMGMTETFGIYSWGNTWRAAGSDHAPPLDRIEPGYSIKIVDGELLVRGPTVTVGLVKVDRSAAFDDDGYYRTGDGGAEIEGRIHFTGRLGDMIKTSGANVSPAEVERELAGLPGVANAFVVGLDDAERGQIVAAALVPDEGADLDLEMIRTSLRARLSSYKVPRAVAVMSLVDVPLTPSQKIDKRRLAALLAERRQSDQLA